MLEVVEIELPFSPVQNDLSVDEQGLNGSGHVNYMFLPESFMSSATIPMELGMHSAVPSRHGVLTCPLTSLIRRKHARLTRNYSVSRVQLPLGWRCSVLLEYEWWNRDWTKLFKVLT